MEQNTKMSHVEQVENYMALVDRYIVSFGIDIKGNLTGVSEALCMLCKYTKEELVGKNYSMLLHSDYVDMLENLAFDDISEGNTWHGDLKMIDKCKAEYWVDTVILAQSDSNGQNIGYLALGHDVTDRKRNETVPITDEKTGLLNRAYFIEIAPRLLSAAKRNTGFFCFLLINIDMFKVYNEAVGFAKGDEALISVSKVLSHTFKRGEDFCFRLNDDMFCAILGEDGPVDSLEMANKFRSAIQAEQILHSANHDYGVLTVSIGLVVKNALDIESVDLLLSEATKALKKAKENGGNSVEIP